MDSKLNSIIKQFVEHGFYSVISGQLTLKNWKAIQLKFLESNNYQVERGLERICIIPSDTKYVIKISLDEARRDRGIDPTLVEFNLYKSAVNDGVDWAFALVEDQGYIYGLHVFTMEKLVVDVAKINDLLLKQYVAVGNDITDFDYMKFASMPLSQIVMAIYKDHPFGKKVKLYKFIKANNIDDLTPPNWGFDAHGNIKILDYAGI